MTSPLRVLHAVGYMGRGGAETLLMNIYRYIDKSLVQFDFLTTKQGDYDKEIESLGGILYRVPYIGDVGPFRYQKELNDFFSSHKYYKIVHTHTDKMGGLILSAAKKAKIPIRIAHSHNTKSEGNILTRIFKWYAGNKVLLNATNYLACSLDAANWLYRSRAGEAIIIKNGIDTVNFQFSLNTRKEVREELNIPEETVVLGHVGRFSPQKNHKYLIDIFTKVNDLFPNTLLILVGDGPLRKDVEERVNTLGLTNKVIFLGSRNDVARFYNAFDIFLFPSLHEGFGIALLEAQVNGLPCIISNVIPKEVDMGIGLIKYLSLDQMDEWVQSVLNVRNEAREIDIKKIIDKGYDIKKTVEQLTTYYLRLSKSL